AARQSPALGDRYRQSDAVVGAGAKTDGKAVNLFAFDLRLAQGGLDHSDSICSESPLLNYLGDFPGRIPFGRFWRGVKLRRRERVALGRWWQLPALHDGNASLC